MYTVDVDQERTSIEQTAVTRRNLVKIAGATLVSTTVLGLSGCASAMPSLNAFPHSDVGPASARLVAGVRVATLDGGSKPVFVPPPGSTDPVAHSVADTLFWGEQLMEHAMFFAMMMPGAELAGPRGEAERFHKQFGEHLARLRDARLDGDNYTAFNNSTLALTNALIRYKRQTQAAQESGRIRSLVWPSFFDHTAKEAERFARRLANLNRGDTFFSRAEVVPFWADKMEEHSLFIAHLLDPDEKVLKGAAEASAHKFAKLEASGADREAALSAAQTIIDFKVAAEKGIQSGAIKSIVHPALADHVRREAIRFKDEVDRSV